MHLSGQVKLVALCQPQSNCKCWKKQEVRAGQGGDGLILIKELGLSIPLKV